MTVSRSEVNDKSTAWLNVSFYDKAGALEIPSAIEWKVVDVTSGAVLQEKVSVGTPASQVELTLTAAVNTIQNDALDQELRRVTVEASFTGGESQTQEYEYLVNNLEQIPLT